MNILKSNFCRAIYPIPKSKPLVSLLIPTKDHVELLSTCIESILNKTNYSNYEILILDNSSQEQTTLDYLNKISQNPKVQVLKYNKPFNFSAINNFGAQKANGEILGFLNNDIEVISHDWMTEMVSHANRDEIGCVGAKLIYDNETIQHGGVILGIGKVAGHSHKHFNRNDAGYLGRLKAVQNLSAVTAACLFIRKETFDAVRGYNESKLAIAFNDVDLCLKVRQKGFRNLWTPYAELYHHESVSRGRITDSKKRKQFAQEKNFMLLLMRSLVYGV